MEMARNTTGTDNDKANRTALAVVLLWVIGPIFRKGLFWGLTITETGLFDGHVPLHMSCTSAPEGDQTIRAPVNMGFVACRCCIVQPIRDLS